MEVHAHTHTARKKWTHYFWEFLMLFLAVFCGFLAENFREHQVEHQREKNYAASLLEDLKKDTADLAHDIPFWTLYISRVDTAQMEIRKPVALRNHLLLYRCVAYMRAYNNFAYHDRTIEQLKSGGNFRLIRNKLISDSLIDYDAIIRSELHDQEMQSNAIWQSLNFLQDRIFDAELYNLSRQETKLDSAVKINPQKIEARKGQEDLLFEYSNRLNYFRAINTFRKNNNEIILRKAINLMEMLKKEYHLK